MNKKKELSPWERVITQRIRTLIHDYCDGSQQRFVEKTGLNKGSVSQYVNGKNVPSIANAEKIADAFNVQVGWVMAYDIIPSGEESTDIEIEAMKLGKRILNLPEEQRLALLKYLQFLGSDS